MNDAAQRMSYDTSLFLQKSARDALLLVNGTNPWVSLQQSRTGFTLPPQAYQLITVIAIFSLFERPTTAKPASGQQIDHCGALT